MQSVLEAPRRPKIVDSFDESKHVTYEIPPTVAEGIRYVERSGWEDMYDRETVMVLAAASGYEEAAEWLVMNRHLYFIALDQARRTIDAVPG